LGLLGVEVAAIAAAPPSNSASHVCSSLSRVATHCCRPQAVAGSLDFQESLQTLYALRFSPNGGSATWLACGGTAGVLRFQRVSGEEG